ncbi:hypothetical protein [Paenibacillus polymyxa]|uniref:hypothetical protein n=1 Tax=Paenibacillus polymyxa TaxID=1406 RepID=UPI0004DF4FED|nr:hypothetical protein [Paenibacillus polymyxa]
MKLFEEILNNQEEVTIEIRNKTTILDRPSIKKIKTKESIEEKLSVLAQFFLLPFQTGDLNAVLHIPVFDKDNREQILQEIGPHFEECKIVEYKDHAQIMFSKLRAISKGLIEKLIDSGEINQIAYSLYRNKSVCIDYSEEKEYKVNIELIQRSSERSIIELWTFLNNTFIREAGELILLPHQWYLGEAFKDYLAVRCFASVCKSMRVTVNPNDKAIKYISIS